MEPHVYLYQSSSEWLTTLQNDGPRKCSKQRTLHRDNGRLHRLGLPFSSSESKGRPQVLERGLFYTDSTTSFLAIFFLIDSAQFPVGEYMDLMRVVCFIAHVT